MSRMVPRLGASPVMISHRSTPAAGAEQWSGAVCGRWAGTEPAGRQWRWRQLGLHTPGQAPGRPAAERAMHVLNHWDMW